MIEYKIYFYCKKLNLLWGRNNEFNKTAETKKRS